VVQLALAILITIVVVVLSIANSHHVHLSFVIGAPVEVRLVFLLMCTFFMGMAAPIFSRLIHRLRSEKKMEREKELQQAMQLVDRDLVGE
jgi:uncharacterized integral membrane protein